MTWVIKDGKRFYLHENETLLAGLIRCEYSPSFECCQGYCGTCKMRVAIKAGSVSHTLPPLCLLEDGEVLACCCVLSGVVELL